jgi:tetratricopeptide (TPR) repeat protein
VLEDQGAIQEALETYQHALAVDATIPDVHYNIARLYEHQGDQRAALHHFSRCRALLRSQQDD